MTRQGDPAEMTRQHEAVKMAIEIADGTARAQIEGWCFDDYSSSRIKLDTSRVYRAGKEAVLRALHYLELRGDDLPYKVMREGALIWFEKKP